MLIRDLNKETEIADIDQLLTEATMDFPANMSLTEMMDEAYRRFTAARQALGISNKLKDAGQRRRHQSKIMTAINNLRGLLGEISKVLGYDKD